MVFRVAAQFVNIPMSYIALARKWRPRTFSQLVGQEHINNALINSLNQQRLHHAYLFTGTRGVGKTSVARLLAKALNCEQGISAEPCLECDACVAIEQGRFIDLIEIDGASRTRVEDTREILENVQYAPTNGRFKIYLIDEVHMLSQHSFNALLKTLEEPPSHVKFLLATTDPQKLPVTVLSRCLQFNLKHIQANVISQQLQFILEQENFPYDLDVLPILALAARGSMRDALSLLDQSIATCGDRLRTSDVKSSLGYTQHDYAIQLLHALADFTPEALLTISKSIADEGGNFRYVLDEMLSYLHQMSICQTIKNNSPLISPLSEISDLSLRFTAEDTQLFYQIALKGTQEMSLAPTMAIGFEMTLLRLYTFKPLPQQQLPALAHNTDLKTTPPVLKTPEPQSTPELVAETQPIISNDASLHSETTTDSAWGSILLKLNLQGLALSAAENAELISKSEGTVLLRVSKGHQSLFTPSILSRIEDALSRYYKEPIKLKLNSDKEVVSTPHIQKQITLKKNDEEAALSLDNDPFFQQLKEEFSAELVKGSIKPC